MQCRIEAIDESLVEPYAHLSKLTKGEVALSSEAHIRWKYLQNPQGTSYGVHLWNGHDLVGRVAATPRTFRFRGRDFNVAYIVDLLVHPDHRGMGSLLKLMRGVAQLRPHFDLILVTPNGDASRIWENFVKIPRRFNLGVHFVALRPMSLLLHRDVGVLPTLARLVDTPWRGLVRGIASVFGASPGFTFEKNWPSPEELDSLWTRENGDFAIGQRNFAFVDWRYRQSPLFNYDVTFLRRDDALLGYVVTRQATYAGYSATFLVDAFGLPDLGRGDWHKVAWHLIGRATRGDAEMLLLLANFPGRDIGNLSAFPLIGVPERFLPHAASVYADWWTTPAFELTDRSVVLTLGDFEMF